MVTKKTWKEFRDSKMLWCANRILHLFGWAIVVEFDDGEIVNAYPARVKFRGFDNKSEQEGFAGLADFVAENADELRREANE